MKGWGIDECQLASVTLIQAFNFNGAISAIINENYTMGSDPLLEINTHSFLFSIFWRDVKDKKMWLLFLLNCVTPDHCPNKLARILLLQFSLPRNHSSPLGPDLYWEDHSEAVPATMEVAISRYQHATGLHASTSNTNTDIQNTRKMDSGEYWQCVTAVWATYN